MSTNSQLLVFLAETHFLDNLVIVRRGLRDAGRTDSLASHRVDGLRHLQESVGLALCVIALEEAYFVYGERLELLIEVVNIAEIVLIRPSFKNYSFVNFLHVLFYKLRQRAFL